MATNPKITTVKTQAVARAAGMVTDVTNQLVTVTFDNLQYNPEFLQGQTRTFKFDIGKARFAVGTWVVASWGSSIRVDSAGHMLSQGSVGNGVYIRPLEFAANNPKLAGWLTQVRQHIPSTDFKLYCWWKHYNWPLFIVAGSSCSSSNHERRMGTI